MSKGRAISLDAITVKIFKSTDKIDTKWLTRLFNIILKTTKMPDEWRWSAIAPMYKNKGNIQNCNNYKCIKFLIHAMKVWERIVEMKVRRGMYILES